MPECNKEHYLIWLENGSDNLFLKTIFRDDIQHECHMLESWDTGVYRRGCTVQRGKPPRTLGRRFVKNKYRITVLWNKVGVFLRKIVVWTLTCLAPFLYHRHIWRRVHF